MKTTKLYIPWLTWIIMFMLVIPPGVMAQDSGQESPQTAQFSSEELAQMLAPIALYPDSLIADILMASTYPIEVVEAERWMKQNGDLKGDQLDTALQEKTWDSSVKSLCHFPDLLYSMSDNLERTTRLGDAFLSQQDDVMNTVQELRRRAEDQGNLRSTEQQKVIVEQQIIKIEPANPEVIYVPAYDPLYVYGPWWYPAYPPYYWYYPPGAVIVGGAIGFGYGVFWGIGISSWSWIDWHHHRIDIDIHKTKRFNRFDRGKWDFDRHVWQHEPEHRRGAAYRDRQTSRHYGMPPSRPSRIRPETRGYPAGKEFGRQAPNRQESFGTTGGRIERQGGQRLSTVQRPSVEQRPATTQRPFQVQRPSTVQRPPTIQRPSAGQSPSMMQRRQSRSNAFSGIGNWNFERRASERGFSSRQSGGFGGGARSDGFRGGRSSGGGSRSGGHNGGFRR